MNPLSLITGNPLYLAIAAAVIFAFGAASGWSVNGWRLGSQLEACNGRVGALAAQVNVLGDKLDTQNQSIQEAANGGQEALKQAGEMLAEARKQSAKTAPALARLEAAIREPAAKRADGTAKDCGDARREIRAAREGGKK